ncbi:hypothetical protein [Agrobacterium genomosp. 2]|jgi:hypothetical protein|uniref:Uncharacterized protein n=1 Tax=Agrobacterium genomosp. 2 str. CFBP 5494 TaxID=1183436 RepID=A0A9W5F3I8_9HYPH|nr:hypothetical protein [Agrobacterium genomosp. 2]CUX03371.1 hypothetical protein AGR2A_pb10132 [Agrobacterium genomosp. 2 str. CFBP 5494]
MSSNETTVHTVERDNNRPLRFTGQRIGYAYSTSDRGRENFSGQTGMSQVLKLFVSKRGEYIACCTWITQWQGHRDSHDAIVTRDREEVFEFFGFGWLAMELYAGTGWDIAEDLDKAA